MITKRPEDCRRLSRDKGEMCSRQRVNQTTVTRAKKKNVISEDTDRERERCAFEILSHSLQIHLKCESQLTNYRTGIIETGKLALIARSKDMRAVCDREYVISQRFCSEETLERREIFFLRVFHSEEKGKKVDALFFLYCLPRGIKYHT